MNNIPEKKTKWLALTGGGLGDNVWDREMIVKANSFDEAYKQIKEMTKNEYDCNIYVIESDEGVGTIKERIKQEALKPIKEVWKEIKTEIIHGKASLSKRKNPWYWFNLLEKIVKVIKTTSGEK